MPFGAVINLANLTSGVGSRLDGPQQTAGGQNSGYSVASAGDINGDGIDDLVIGAPGAEPGGQFIAGSSYVVFGTALGLPAQLDLSNLNGVNGFRIDGAAGGDQSGTIVAPAGDINGDGIDDLIIGASRASANGVGTSGSTFVLFGRTGAWGATFALSALDGTNGFRLDGVAGDDASGEGAASAGDVNGDGFDDLIIGARGADPGGLASAGSAYVVFGKASGWSAAVSLSALNGANGFRLDGAQTMDLTGYAVASAGDVNGDGFDDVIIGARRFNANSLSDAGAAYVVFGKASGWASGLALSSLDGTNGFRLDGGAALDEAGYSVSGAGDINGDGFADVIVGAMYADPGGRSSAGTSYVVFGKASGWSAALALSSLNGANGFRLEGLSGGDWSGCSVAAAGDVNGDGYGDIIIGAYGAAPGGVSSAGSSFVLLGKPSGWTASVSLSSLNGTNGFRADGAAGVVVSGASVASAGDVNFDGFDDVVIGAHLSGSGAGSSFVVYGKATGAILRSGRSVGERMWGGEFNDSLSGLGGADTLIGNSGEDTLVGGAQNDELYGGAGDDDLIGGPGADLHFGDSGGFDVARYNSSTAAVTVYTDNPALGGGDAAGDSFFGIEAWDLTDLAGAGDVFFGDADAERVFANAGNDLLFGNGGADSLVGSQGDDFLLGGDGPDTLRGGDGFDAVYFGDSGAAVSINLATGMHAGFAAGDSFDSVEAFLLTEQADAMTGLDSAGLGDVIFGLGGNDALAGLGGFDWLIGGDGADTLTGGFGWDLLIGGAGADRFVYETGGQGGSGEVISDFAPGTDKIAFVTATSGIAGFTLGQNLLIQAGAPTGSQGATAGPTLYYDATGGLLWFDTNGSTAGGLIYLAGLTGAPTLTAADFMVI